MIIFLCVALVFVGVGYAAFCGNMIEILNIGKSLNLLGADSFIENYDNSLDIYTLTVINIYMKQSTWEERGLPATGWYDGTPTINYN